MNEQEFRELAAGHALNALSDADERAFQSELAAHPEWESHVAADLDAAAALGDAAEPVEPPMHVRSALLSQIAGMPQHDAARGSGYASDAADVEGDQESDVSDAGAASLPVGEKPYTAPVTPVTSEGSPRRSRRWFYALAASLTLIVALGVGAFIVTQQLVQPPAVVALEQIEDAPDAQTATATTADGGEATVHWSDSVGQTVIVTDGFPALPAGRTFELWFVRGETPIPAGTFAVDDSGEAVALLAGEVEPGDIVAVTVEEDGGSPSGLPTTDPIIAITT